VCDGSYCKGPDTEVKTCNTQNCAWNNWQVLTSCPVKCGGGEQTFTRTCSGRAGTCGSDHTTDTRPCNTHDCSWLEWQVRIGYRSSNTHATATYLGSKYMLPDGNINVPEVQKDYCPNCDSRKKLYSMTYSRECDGSACVGKKSEVITCNHIPDCNWSTWSTDKPCTSTCNEQSTKELTRTCQHGTSNNGHYCKPDGNNFRKTEICPLIQCRK
jgi:hypothetical protein